jgi:CRISPR/Cas system-associated exonuclease Cas4 (RecB family)
MNNRDLPIRLYEAIHAGDEPREYNHWHASALTKCPREQWLLRKGVPKTRQIGGGLKLRWQVGHAVEERVRPYLKSIYPELESNVRLTSEELQLTGEFDNYDPITRTIIEVKSVHPYAFKRTKPGEPDGLRDDKPYVHHEYQNHAYVLLMNEEDLTPESITYLYVSLDGRICAYTTPVQDLLVVNVRKRLELLNSAWETGIAPPCWCADKAHPLYDVSMKWCDYQQEGHACCLLEDDAA